MKLKDAKTELGMEKMKDERLLPLVRMSFYKKRL